jgi:striatin 1/3/4
MYPQGGGMPNMNNPMGNSYNWNGVMDFLQDQLKNSQIRESEWLIERQQLLETLTHIQEQLRTKDDEIQILNKKLKLMDHHLQQERAKYTTNKPFQPNHMRVRSDVVANLIHGQGDKIDKIVTNSITSSIIYSSVHGGQGRRQKSGGHPVVNKFFDEVNYNNLFTPPGSEAGPKKKPCHRQTNSFGGTSTQPFILGLEKHKKKSDEYAKMALNNYNSNYSSGNAPTFHNHSQPLNLNMNMPANTGPIHSVELSNDPFNSHNNLMPQHNFQSHSGPSQNIQQQPLNMNPSMAHHFPNQNVLNNSFLMNPMNNASFVANNSFQGNSNVNLQNNNNSANVNPNSSFLINQTTINQPINQTLNELNKITNQTKITPSQKLNLMAHNTNKRKWIDSPADSNTQNASFSTNIVSSSVATSATNINMSAVTNLLEKNKIKTTHSKLYKEPKVSTESIEDTQMPFGKKLLHPKCSLRSHMDGVRGVHFSSKDPVLTTVSEDCMVKLWDVRTISHSGESSHVEPYYTFRCHSGPLFSIAGSPQTETSNQNLIFTGGSEGVIKVWSLPHPDMVDCYGPCGQNNYCVGIWNAHQDVIWELNHHPTEDWLLSSSSDGTVKLWQTLEFEDGMEDGKISNGNILGTYCFKNGNLHNYDTPTSVNWIYGKHDGIIAGYVFSPSLAIFDKENGKLIHTMKFGEDSLVNNNNQPNKILTHPSLSCVVSGHEDKQIRFFDLNSNKLIKTVTAHTDAVTGLSLKANKHHLVSVGHDGSVRTWDIRKYQCIHETPAHKKKFDEAIHTVTHHDKLPLLATGGADGIVKIFQYCD